MSVEQASDVWMPASPADRDAVRQQLERMLAAPLFHASKRYPSFLRFVITNTLAGQTDLLKERLLGIEIFGRAPDYDTTRDPIVRVTAAEIRKRIEQYYQEPEHAAELRFFLPSGSYVPQFYLPGHPKPRSALPSPQTNGTPRFWQLLTRLRSKRAAFSTKKVILTLAALAVAIGATAAWYASRPSVIKRFWGPFVKTGEPVLFCIADQSQFSTIRELDAADPSRHTTLTDESLVAVVIDDVSPLINIAGMLRAYGKNYRVLGEATTTLNDLRRGPSVFIGAFTNGWTLRLTAPLRFHFANDPEMTRFSIEDRANPAKRDWVLYRAEQKHTGIYKDYAIVARLVDPDTEQFVVVAAGIGRGGTVAAGEFLVDAQRMNEIVSHVPKDWERRNMEIVLETQVINWQSGPPRICSVHVW